MFCDLLQLPSRSAGVSCRFCNIRRVFSCIITTAANVRACNAIPTEIPRCFWLLLELQFLPAGAFWRVCIIRRGFSCILTAAASVCTCNAIPTENPRCFRLLLEWQFQSAGAFAGFALFNVDSHVILPLLRTCGRAVTFRLRFLDVFGAFAGARSVTRARLALPTPPGLVRITGGP